MQQTTERPNTYLLESGPEKERLRLQARVWEPDAEIMLDRIGVREGWRCADLGCGGMGVLGPLSRRVGETGHVLGLDMEPVQVEAAREYVRAERLENVHVLCGDAHDTGFPAASFDLTHVRFLFAPVGRDASLLDEMLRITRPGGILAIQEPDPACWACHPSHPAWDDLKSVILEAFRRSGGDFAAGTRTFTMLRQAGLEDVQLRNAVVALQDGHPYLRVPIMLAVSLRRRILDEGLMTERALDSTIEALEGHLRRPNVTGTGFLVTQVWGRKPA